MKTLNIIFIGLLTISVFLLWWEFRKMKKSLPKLRPGERFAAVPEDHSNVTVVRDGDQVIMTDEEFDELDINKIVR